MATEQVNDEHIDVLVEIEEMMLSDGLTKKERATLLEAKKEIESLRKALTLFSEEFETIQKQDAEILKGFSEGPIH